MYSIKQFLVYKFSCIWLLVAIFVFEIPVKSQKYYLFHSYTTKEGLANNSIMTINQDRYGYLWVGTDAGISRFDGYEFDNRPIPAISDNAAFVEYIDKDDSGNLIITGFMQGIHIQQPNGSFQQYLMKKKQIGKNCPNTLKTWTNKRILVGQARMLDIFENGKFKRIYDCGVDRQAVISIETDRKNNIWFGGFFGLAILEANDTIYTPYFLPELKNKLIIKILFDSDGNLLAGTSQGFYKITFNDRTNWRKGYEVTQPFP